MNEDEGEKDQNGIIIQRSELYSSLKDLNNIKSIEIDRIPVDIFKKFGE